MSDAKTVCPRCASPLETPAGSTATARCPVCDGAEPQLADGPSVAAATATEPVPTGAAGPACPFCLAGIGDGEATAACPACHAVYHQECWQENGGCAVYGCTQVPAVESRQAIEIPMSYWGQENKPCPACGRQILAAAVRCRHCGATFASARPQDSAEFQRRTSMDQRLPEVRRLVVWMFVCCVVPLTSPVGAVWGAVWYPAHREEVEALPPFYRALCKIGIGAAIVLTVGVAVMTCLYAVVRR
jgi:hypothetical protein